MEIGLVVIEAYVGTIRAHSRDVMSQQSPSPGDHHGFSVTPDAPRDVYLKERLVSGEIYLKERLVSG